MLRPLGGMIPRHVSVYYNCLRSFFQRYFLRGIHFLRIKRLETATCPNLLYKFSHALDKFARACYTIVKSSNYSVSPSKRIFRLMLKPTRPTGFRSALLSCLLGSAAFLNASCASAITPIYEHKDGALPSIRFMLPGEIPLEFITLPAGSIAMQVNRKPQANETKDRDGRVVYKFKENELSIGKFEVTQAQWQEIGRAHV